MSLAANDACQINSPGVGANELPRTICTGESQDGWAAFSCADLLWVLMGNPQRGLTGYYNYQRVLNLKRTLKMDVPEFTVPLDMSPQNFLSIFHERKMDYYQDLRLVIHNEEAGYKEIKLLTRGMPAYDAKVGDNFDDLRDFMIDKNLPCVFLTLSPRTPEGHSPLYSLLDMKAIQNKLMSFLQAKLGFRPKYVWVIEQTQRGHCHYHFLFVGMNYLLPKEELDSWFECQGLGDEHGVYIETVNGPDQAKKTIRYLISYLTKPHKDARWSGLLALTRKREWGMSNDLRRRINRWIMERMEGAEGQDGLACQGTINSNCSFEWSMIGILTLLEIEKLINGKDPPPNELREDLRQIHGMIYAWKRGKWHWSDN